MAKGHEYLIGPGKRRLDVVGGSLLALGLAPIGAAAGALACIDNRRINPLFKQKRAGAHGKDLEIAKFRTIREANMTDTYESFGVIDPRASVIGQNLRRFGLDEYPQLLQIVRGDLSLVGVRPVPTLELELIQSYVPSSLYNEWFNDAYEVGVYGLSSSSAVYRHHHGMGRNRRETYERSLELDLEYTHEASLSKDVLILAQTPLSVLAGGLMSIREKFAEAK